MNATAVDYQPVEPASTEGLADLFHSTKTPIIEQGDSDQTPIIEQSDSGQTPITEQGDSDQTPVNDQGDPDHVVIDALLKQLANAQKELQAAVWRNGYLEAQLEAERQQVKLLTDSQHKPGWWTKFMSWFKRA